ncbi:hypothetical protein ACIO3R_07140 [Streptomyces sp. NPDC087428]
MITLSKTDQADTAYRTWLGHTLVCTTCLAGAPCAAAAHLGRAWRAARR